MAHDRGRFTSRTKSRKRAAEVLYEADQKRVISSPSDLLSLLEERKAITSAPSPLPAYAIEIVEGVATALPEVDSLLNRHAKGAGIDRLPAVDLAVLRVAVWEMLFNSADVPRITAIDEAVSVVKQISTDTSPAYVNAVLDAVRLHLEAVPQPAREPEPASTTSESSNTKLPEQVFEEDFELDELLDEY